MSDRYNKSDESKCLQHCSKNNTDENEKPDNVNNTDNSLSLTSSVLSAPSAALTACLVTTSAACLVTVLTACLVAALTACLVITSAAGAASPASSVTCLVTVSAAAAVTSASSFYLLSEILIISSGLNVFHDEKNSKHYIDPAPLSEKTSTRILKFTDIDKDKNMQMAENDEKEQKMISVTVSATGTAEQP
ncbi:hypothetical protein BDFG_01258 [Blastomyces dermatitidis ATCC 26199]|nr:hypothetical protein BDFG_01258 [Blastomyces dermatitidis ATCC 26199]